VLSRAALVAIVVYVVAFYKLTGGIVLAAAWLYLYVTSPAMRFVEHWPRRWVVFQPWARTGQVGLVQLPTAGSGMNSRTS
jgi:hypothetical protein